MRSREQPVDKAKLDELREALKQAAARSDAETSSLLRRRDQLADELLKMKSAARDAGSDEEESLLRKKERELDRLDRELGDAKAAARELDRLDRELEQAAEDLMKDLGQSAQDIDDSAQDINHLQEQEMTQKEKEELKEKIEELRQLMRQQGQGGKPQMARLKRFSRMARGGKGQREGEGGDGQSGGESQESQTGGDPRSGQGQGGSEADGQGETWILGPNGEKVLMLSNAKGTGQEPGGRGGEGHEGRGAGQGHDTNVQGKATHAKMSTEDTQVQGVDTGQGGARSQVILGAAEKGFASKRYEKVYTEYHQVAEESLRKDEIPGGYRFYVKRYFQLIRPREEP
jgi:hypothetical protein